jgi:hypothetical protein
MRLWVRLSTWHSLRPLVFEGHIVASSGEKIRRGNADLCLGVIASQRVRAKRGPMTGSAKPAPRMRFLIASSLSLLATTTKSLFEN